MRHEIGAFGTAAFSECMRYRYSLTVAWDSSKPQMMFIGLNPSTATHEKKDPTLGRVVGFAKQWGFGGVVMTNIFAWRDTDPFAMMDVDEPVGLENDEVLVGCAKSVAFIVAGWGVHGSHRGRGDQVRVMLEERGGLLHHLGLTKHGYPRHPLYLRDDSKPQAWLYDE
jgi:hypothetical protein